MFTQSGLQIITVIIRPFKPYSFSTPVWSIQLSCRSGAKAYDSTLPSLPNHVLIYS